MAVAPLPESKAAAGLVAGAVGAVAIGWFTSTHMNAALPWLDATRSSFSLVAQVWIARRQHESWLLWIAVDGVYVGLIVFKGLMLTAGLYAVLIVLAAVGYAGWQQRQAVTFDAA